MTVVPVLAAVFEAQNKCRHCRFLSEYYIGGDKLVSKKELIFEAHCTYSKTGPLPSLGYVCY